MYLETHDANSIWFSDPVLLTDMIESTYKKTE